MRQYIIKKSRWNQATLYERALEKIEYYTRREQDLVKQLKHVKEQLNTYTAERDKYGKEIGVL